MGEKVKSLEERKYCTAELEIGFSLEHSMIFIFDPHFMRTSPLWLVCSLNPAVAYLPAPQYYT
jgi:hypothetical protein